MQTLTALALLALGMQAQLLAEGKHCEAQTVQGRYALSGTGFSVQGPNVAVFSLLAAVTFDGKGGLTGNQTANAQGQLFTQTFNGNYQLNPDCSGTLTINVPGSPAGTFDIVSLRRGQEIMLVQTVPGEIVAGSLKRL